MEQTLVADALYFALLMAPVALLLWMMRWLWIYLQEYYHHKWYLGVEYKTLEVRLPKEQMKTPAAMESVLAALWEPGDSSGWKEQWLGVNTLPIFSLEVASIGGSIHFFIWAPKKFKPRIESHIYAQYPQAEILEVPDYTRLIDFDVSTHKIMGFDYKQTGADLIPIKTYKMSELDRPGAKEEEKVDPITQTLEVMASIGPHENMWWQIVCRPLKQRYTKEANFKKRLEDALDNGNPFLLFRKPKGDWSVERDKMIKDLVDKYTPKDKDTILPFFGGMQEQDKQRAQLWLMNAQKVAYEVGMRTIYFAPKEHFDGDQPSNMGSMFKAYGAGEPYNNFKPAFVAAKNDKWWEQPRQGREVDKLKALMFPDYMLRRYFVGASGTVGSYAKDQYKTMTLSVEELATLYHFPGSVAQTPTFERIPSATVEAPANLPTGGAPGNLPM